MVSESGTKYEADNAMHSRAAVSASRDMRRMVSLPPEGELLNIWAVLWPVLCCAGKQRARRTAKPGVVRCVQAR